MSADFGGEVSPLSPTSRPASSESGRLFSATPLSGGAAPATPPVSDSVSLSDSPTETTNTSGGAKATGLRAVTADEFNALGAMGGVRGLVEAILPGLIFITVFTLANELWWALIASLAVAVITVIARLIQRSSVQQALSGIFGILIGVFWAWRTGEATDFFAFALFQNAAYLVVVLILQLVGWPAVGLILELLRFSMSAKETPAPTPVVEPTSVVEQRPPGATVETTPTSVVEQRPPGATVETTSTNPFHGFSAWRNDPNLLRRYRLATWFWIALFAVRLAVQVPLFLGQSVGWLGIARIIMGVPLWGLTLYLTWAVIHGAHKSVAIVP